MYVNWGRCLFRSPGGVPTPRATRTEPPPHLSLCVGPALFPHWNGSPCPCRWSAPAGGVQVRFLSRPRTGPTRCLLKASWQPQLRTQATAPSPAMRPPRPPRALPQGCSSPRPCSGAPKRPPRCLQYACPRGGRPPTQRPWGKHKAEKGPWGTRVSRSPDRSQAWHMQGPDSQWAGWWQVPITLAVTVGVGVAWTPFHREETEACGVRSLVGAACLLPELPHCARDSRCPW